MTLRFLKDQPTAVCAAAAVEPVTAELTAAYDRIRDLERRLSTYDYEQTCRDRDNYHLERDAARRGLNLVNAELARVRDQFVRLQDRLTEAREERDARPLPAEYARVCDQRDRALGDLETERAKLNRRWPSSFALDAEVHRLRAELAQALDKLALSAAFLRGDIEVTVKP